MERLSRKSQLVLFVAISNAYLWSLFGIKVLFDIPFGYDPGQWGGILVLVGIPASLIAAVVVTGISQGREGVPVLIKRSLAWRFPLKWYLAPIAYTSF